MNQKIKGIITSVGTLIILIILSIIVSSIVSGTSSSGWDGLVVAIMMFFATGFIMVVLLIFGIVKYYKRKSQFGLGIIYGVVGIVVFGIAFSLLIPFL